MQDRTVKNLATLFGIGYLPIMPGTFASLFGLFIYLLIRNNIIVYLVATAIFTILGFAVCGKAERLFKKKDPSAVVIDEFCGMLIVYILVPFNISNLIIGLIIFRFVDILKLYPINKLERFKKGWGVMADDMAAGVLTNVILQILNYIL